MNNARYFVPTPAYFNGKKIEGNDPLCWVVDGKTMGIAVDGYKYESYFSLDHLSNMCLKGFIREVSPAEAVLIYDNR